MQSIEWATGDTIPTLPRIHILAPGPNQTLEYLAVSEYPEYPWTHFVNGFTQPCQRAFGECDGCKRQLRRALQAYVAVLWGSQGYWGLARFSMEPARGLKEWLQQGPARNLRGRTLRHGRSGAHVRAKQWVTVGNTVRDLATIPQPFDVRAFLTKLFNGGYSRIQDDARETG